MDNKSKVFEKELTANDTGMTGGHQAGVHIPKSQEDLLSFLPSLDASAKNPDEWIEMEDDKGEVWRFRYIYYNNRMHDVGGTRDEYRITHMTKFFREVGAGPGDFLVLSRAADGKRYRVSVRKAGVGVSEPVPLTRVKLRGWRRVY